MYFSGGATNPFVSFYLLALGVAAAILPWRLAFALALHSFVSYFVLTYCYQTLSIHDHRSGMAYHLAGMWGNFAVSAALITWFVTLISSNLRQREAQLAQARDCKPNASSRWTRRPPVRRMKWGMPLATIAVIAGELQHETRRNPALASYGADLAIIEQQITVCKAALDHMRVDADPPNGGSSSLDLKHCLQTSIDGWRLRYPDINLAVILPENDGRSANPRILSQLLLTLLDKAARAVDDNHGRVQVMLQIVDGTTLIKVEDSGTGIDAGLLRRLGYEPVAGSTDGKVIGLLLAFESARQARSMPTSN